MTLIESLTLAAIHGFGRFIPVSSEAHELILQQTVHFPIADVAWRTTFALGAFTGLTIYFIHDWASILSSFLQVVIYRKRPMTLDERLPFFFFVCSIIPFSVLTYFFKFIQSSSLVEIQVELQKWTLAGLLIGSFLLLFSERWSRKNRGPFSLGTVDSLFLGFGQTLSWIPGFGGTLGILSVTQFRSFHLETATKLASLMSLPFISFEVFSGWNSIQWRTSSPIANTSWTQWSLTFLVSLVATFLALRTLNEQLRQTGFKKIALYRLMVFLVLAGVTLWSR